MTALDDRRYHGFGPRPDGTYALSGPRIDPANRPPEILALMPDVVAAAAEPFVGITTDGSPVPDLFAVQDEDFDPKPAVHAAENFLAALSAGQRKSARFDIDAKQWRLWTNAYPTWEPHGVYLDDVGQGQRDAALAVMEASLSAKGFSDARTAMRLNAALGELIGQYPGTLKEYAYFFALYGTPSVTSPWGWQLWGHHLVLHCFVLGSQLVLTPAFVGAEPVTADRGTYQGLRLFDAEREAGLALRRSFTRRQERRAVLHRSLLSAELPADLVNFVDGRHKGGAGRDNRVIPLEGLRAGNLSAGQQDLLLDLIGTYAGRAPAGPAAALMARIRAHLDETHVAWIGGDADGDAFYYKVHSPVLLIEYDCHQGVFLDNEEPEPFHVHTIVRTPNGGDYGHDLLRRHYAQHHHHSEGTKP
ncbi:DUF3500 domain-containing protein [Amycolatopsis pithecellobii]|uniref:DUF3500 domain-containing protein n=1 Tax=Amycolatopsis pithecellobii TaxID=664692 RepID=A0A6N7Z318_9PSEU|nr:DUF3500 domain-containing protein [Amycolatopsis pithecellobii]MTD53216.1 DUF3500 domain-containing protein [Amycolatopsis pithecellobii]